MKLSLSEIFFRFYNKVKLYLNNSYWLFVEKVVRIVITFFISVILARYLGADQYGLLAYIISITSLFAIGAHMGLSGLLVKELVKSDKPEGAVLGTALVMKLLGAFTGFFSLLLYLFIVEKNADSNQWLLFLASFIVFASVFDLFDSWFNSKLLSKYVALAQLSTLAISTILKVVFVILEAPFIYFIYAILIEAALLAIFRIMFYAFKNKNSIYFWKYSNSLAKIFFKQGGLIFLGSIFAIIYLKVDLVMLRIFSSNEQMGIYAVASRLSEAFYIIPAVLMISFYPKLIELYEKANKQFILRIQQLLDAFFILALFISISIIFVSETFITFAYGDDFRQSAYVLNIHILASLFIFMRAVFSKWIIINNVVHLSLFSQGFGAIVNCILNLILIPKYGSIGAAIATLISYSIASYFVLVLFPKSRIMFYMMTKSIFFPLRLFKQLKKIN